MLLAFAYHIRQEAQLSQTDGAMLRITEYEYFGKSLKVTQRHSK